ncbi:hypothetical protein HaLaN_19766 [Haematococcus lacustris]|uniref:F-box domain-containing protein n=1 Tax=Haematococcus lacustris TaxID=44745 RepID=A0A699ZHX4_HAELA|nr:hypothetical protein HaLaN_19766 [Haematococcus lacustris]
MQEWMQGFRHLPVLKHRTGIGPIDRCMPGLGMGCLSLPAPKLNCECEVARLWWHCGRRGGGSNCAFPQLKLDSPGSHVPVAGLKHRNTLSSTPRSIRGRGQIPDSTSLLSQVLPCAVLWARHRAGPMRKSSAGDVNKSQQLQGLQGLPMELLDAVLSQLDASSRLPVFMTSKLLATALLRISPRIQLTYPTPHDVIGQHLRELAPFLIEILQNRQQPKLHLTLQPASSLTDAVEQCGEAEPAAAASDAARLVARMLGAVPLCGAVDCLTIEWHYPLDLPWEPDFSAALAASFPSLTSLAYREARMSIGHLANAINHPLLLPKLLHLDIDGITITHKGQLGRSPFIGSRLQTLSLDADVDVNGEDEFLYGLVPLPPTLTQLVVSSNFSDQLDWGSIAAAVSSLTQLQQLRLTDEIRAYYESGPGLMALLPALAHLPSLHTLQMSEFEVGQEQLGALLALTQITSLQVDRFSGLTSSWASAACSWRQLDVHKMDWDSAAYLPLHSLTHPLHLYQLRNPVLRCWLQLSSTCVSATKQAWCRLVNYGCARPLWTC